MMLSNLAATIVCAVRSETEQTVERAYEVLILTDYAIPRTQNCLQKWLSRAESEVSRRIDLVGQKSITVCLQLLQWTLWSNKIYI